MPTVLPPVAPLFAQAETFNVAGGGGNSLLGWGLVLLAFSAVVVGGFVLRRTTRTGVLAAATGKEAVRQPVFYLAIGIGLVILTLNTFLPFFSLGDDVKMLKDTGLSTILIAGLLVSIWTASGSIHDEIEGKTAMTLLSKPVNRRQFILGKYLGILRGAGILTAVLAATLVLLVFYKVGYDAKEAGGGKLPYFEWYEATRIPWLAWVDGVTGEPSDVLLPQLQRLIEALSVIPSVLLVYLQICVLTAVSVAVATRLPIVVNLSICLSVYIIGYLSGVLVQWEPKEEGAVAEGVKFVAGLIATVLPNLTAYSSETAVARGAIVPPEYLAWVTLYTLVFSAAAILVAFLLFEDRDLA